jgi:hypothetical protein
MMESTHSPSLDGIKGSPDYNSEGEAAAEPPLSYALLKAINIKKSCSHATHHFRHLISTLATESKAKSRESEPRKALSVNVNYLTLLSTEINNSTAQCGQAMQFMQNIQSLYKMVSSLLLDDVAELPIAKREELILEHMHSVNFNSIEEACLGFRAVMSSRKFMHTLLQHFDASDAKRQLECFLIFKYWIIECNRLYQDEILEPRTWEIIKLFVAKAEKLFGAAFLSKINAHLEQLRAPVAQESNAIDIIKSLNSPKAAKICQVTPWIFFIELFKGDAMVVAEELLAETIHLQAQIKADIFDSSRSSPLLNEIPEINNRLKDSMITDIRNSIEGHEKIKKYEFYLNLFEASYKVGNLFVCMALIGLFLDIGKEFADCQEVRKYDTQIANLIALTGSKDGLEFRNELLKDKQIPCNLVMLFNILESLKERCDPYLAREGQKKVINAYYIAEVALVAKDLLMRQQSTVGCRSKAKLFEALLVWRE